MWKDEGPDDPAALRLNRGGVRAAKWTDYSSLVGCQQVSMEAGALSVPWSDSLRRNVIRNATTVEDRPGGLAGGVGGGTLCDVRAKRRVKRSPWSACTL